MEKMEIASLDLEDIGVTDLILERLNEDYDCISDALDFSKMGNDERTEVGKVRFISVTFGSNNSIDIEYEYDWSLYHGCKDLNASGKEEGHITGTYKNGEFQFPVIPSSHDRSTFDEF